MSALFVSITFSYHWDVNNLVLPSNMWVIFRVSAQFVITVRYMFRLMRGESISVLLLEGQYHKCRKRAQRTGAIYDSS